MSDFHLRKYKKDQRIFNAGARGDAAYILKSGAVEISVEKAGKKVVLAILEPPVVFGEMALLLDDSERTATAIAVEESELVIIERENFLAYLKAAPPVLAHVVEHLAKRVEETSMKAARTPNVFMGICKILNLMILTVDEAEISYQGLLDTICSLFMLSHEEASSKIEMMESLGLLEIEGGSGREKTIEINDEEGFLDQAEKVYTIAKTLGSSS